MDFPKASPIFAKGSPEGSFGIRLRAVSPTFVAPSITKDIHFKCQLPSRLGAKSGFGNVPEWDSLGIMAILAEIGKTRPFWAPPH